MAQPFGISARYKVSPTEQVPFAVLQPDGVVVRIRRNWYRQEQFKVATGKYYLDGASHI